MVLFNTNFAFLALCMKVHFLILKFRGCKNHNHIRNCTQTKLSSTATLYPIPTRSLTVTLTLNSTAALPGPLLHKYANIITYSYSSFFSFPHLNDTSSLHAKSRKSYHISSQRFHVIDSAAARDSRPAGLSHPIASLVQKPRPHTS